jgi:hypothetical protein
MRERRALQTLREIAATQSAQQLASEASLATAIDLERARESDVLHARGRLDEAIEDWRGALERQAVDAALLRLFAEAPKWRESELNQAEAARTKAQAHANAQRLRHGEIIARLRRSALMHKRLKKRVERKQEEKTLSALELIGRVGP